MTKEEQLRFCLALAFQSMVTQGKEIKSEGVTDRIIAVARLMSEFCDFHMAEAFPSETMKLVDDKYCAQVDAALNGHLDELSLRGETKLPVKREELIQFYDRLQQRKMRREQWLYYANATEDQLADKVLGFLDKELEDRQKAT